MSLYKKSLFIFRRDLRIEDNTGLNNALNNSTSVISCFIFDPRQISKQNEYRSTNAIQFMIESLQDLQDQLKKQKGMLYFFAGKAEDIVRKLIKSEHIDAVFVNRDYTLFSKERDSDIKTICSEHGIAFISNEDAMLHAPEDVYTQKGSFYKVFTSYWKKGRTLAIANPQKLAGKNFYAKRISLSKPDALKKYIPKLNQHLAVHGGTQQAKKILKNLKRFKQYAQERDIPSLSTTMLSAHNKFGTVSIRTVREAMIKQLGKSHPLIRQLYWRDFYLQIAFFAPWIFGQPFDKRFRKITWRKSNKDFERWCKGTTGFPIIDAGMRQLNTTGFMHNRVRMIVASFLVKDLHINWLWGEKYFAQQLVDYDPSVNNGNWQWVAGTGCDAAPYFRIFNPWLQQKNFDPNCKYIKEWIPELKNVDNAIIHTWFKKDSPIIKNYPRPMINHAKEREITKKLFKKAISENE